MIHISSYATNLHRQNILKLGGSLHCQPNFYTFYQNPKVDLAYLSILQIEPPASFARIRLQLHNRIFYALSPALPNKEQMNLWNNCYSRLQWEFLSYQLYTTRFVHKCYPHKHTQRSPAQPFRILYRHLLKHHLLPFYPSPGSSHFLQVSRI